MLSITILQEDQDQMRHMDLCMHELEIEPDKWMIEVASDLDSRSIKTQGLYGGAVVEIEHRLTRDKEGFPQGRYYIEIEGHRAWSDSMPKALQRCINKAFPNGIAD